jgi:hypothetical protein
MEELQIIEQALNLATKQGCYNIDEVVKIKQVLESLKAKIVKED